MSKTTVQPMKATDFVYNLLRMVEKQATSQDTTGAEFKSTTDRAYWGIRLSDPIKISLKGREYPTTFENLFNAYQQPINLLLTLRSLEAERRVRSFVIRAKKDGKRVKKGQVLGTKYWTVENEKFLSGRTGVSIHGGVLPSLSELMPQAEEDVPSFTS